MIETRGLHQHPFWAERVKAFYGRFNKSASKTSRDAWTWEEGENTTRWSTARGASKRNQSVPVNPADCPNPEAKAVPWRDIGDLNTSLSFLYPASQADQECPVPKNDYLEKEHQQACMQWIEKTLDLDRRTSKDPRLYCGYCDMNNHSRFACKHAFKHQKPNERHRCTFLHSYAPGHRSMEVRESPTGKRSSTSAQSRNLGNLIIDGEKKQLMSSRIFPLYVLKVQVKLHSRSAQQQQ